MIVMDTTTEIIKIPPIATMTTEGNIETMMIIEGFPTNDGTTNDNHIIIIKIEMELIIDRTPATKGTTTRPIIEEMQIILPKIVLTMPGNTTETTKVEISPSMLHQYAQTVAVQDIYITHVEIILKMTMDRIKPEADMQVTRIIMYSL